MATAHDIKASQFADWLAREAGDRLWTVDGEDRLLESLRLPCSGEELSRVLREIGGRLRVFISWDHSDTKDLSEFADTEDGGRVFEVAWLNKDKPGPHWVIAEDTLAEKAAQAAAH
jgi:hypothetical protein